MKNKKTEESRVAYNKIASEYDKSIEGQYTRFHITELSNTIDLGEGDIVLDIACGNGTLLRGLSKKAKIQANGIDISENMIHVAKPNYGALLRFFANKIWFPFSKSGDVRVYSPKELGGFFYNSGFKTIQVYRKDNGIFLKAKK